MAYKFKLHGKTYRRVLKGTTFQMNKWTKKKIKKTEWHILVLAYNNKLNESREDIWEELPMSEYLEIGYQYAQGERWERLEERIESIGKARKG